MGADGSFNGLIIFLVLVFGVFWLGMVAQEVLFNSDVRRQKEFIVGTASYKCIKTNELTVE